MKVEKTRETSLRRLLVVQTQVAFNDNAAKLMLILLAGAPGVLPPQWVVPVIGGLTALLILPFIGFSPFAGWLADRYSKTSVLHAGLALQVAVMAGLAVSLFLQSMPGAMVCFGLLAVQSALFSPAKRGILKELVTKSRLSRAVGWMEMLTIAAILLGSLSGALMFDLFSRVAGGPWQGAFAAACLLSVLALSAWILFRGAETTPARCNEPYRHGIWWRHFFDLGELWRDRPLFRAGLGGTWFFSLGGLLYLTVAQIAREVHGGDSGTGVFTALMLALLGAGSVAGHLSAGWLSRGRVELGLVPIGCVGMACALAVVAFAPPGTIVFGAGLMGLGFAGGLFLVPLYAFLQDRASDHRRGRVLASVNIMESLGGLAAAGVYVLMARVFGLGPSQQLLCMLAGTLLVGAYVVRLLPDSFARAVVRCLALPVYRIRARGVAHLPHEGGAILIANHVSRIDAIILQLASPRRLHFLGFDGLRKFAWLRWAFRLFEVIPVSGCRAREALKEAARRAAAGEVVCLFPEGAITRTGSLQELKRGFVVVAKGARVPVVPVWVDGLWGSIFSFRDGGSFLKLPRRFPCPVGVDFGAPIPWEEASADRARAALLDLSEAAFRERPELDRHLGRECVRALAKQPWREAFVDHTAGRRPVSRGKLLAVAAALSGRLRATVPERRVGIVLPPGAGGAIANLAVVLAGKVPVNLNFTAGRASIESSLECGGIRTVVTADAMKSRAGDFPWPERTINLATEIRACGRLAILARMAAIATFPAALTARLPGLPHRGGDREAGLLFTSGSSGDPKGVTLSHRNILGNAEQIDETGVLATGDTVLGSLPLFHSFGFTVTLWCAILKGIRVATVPSPLDARRIARVIEEERATVHVGTPTFLRMLLRQAEPAAMRSLRMVVSGAERLPDDLAAEFRERFGVPVLQGYGLTETSPVAAVNVPDPEVSGESMGAHRGEKPGAVGRLVPGMTARVVDPETLRELPLETPGMLWLKGVNVFSGYLGDESSTRACFRDGWFVTGDIARVDRDGFLFIEGRLSRFSKIGGEMVPHALVEEGIVAALGLGGLEEPAVAVTGVEDSKKGEALVVLAALDLREEILRKQLVARGFPNLWIPRIIRRVERIPLLGSGKLDLKACRTLVGQGAGSLSDLGDRLSPSGC